MYNHYIPQSDGSYRRNPQPEQRRPNPPRPKPEPPKPEPPPPMPDIDPAMIGKMMSIAGKSNIDQNQKALLRALQPYLSNERLLKLEKAMRVARLAGAVSSILPSGGISFLTGR